jgi:hypothetical protein
MKNKAAMYLFVWRLLPYAIATGFSDFAGMTIWR